MKTAVGLLDLFTIDFNRVCQIDWPLDEGRLIAKTSIDNSDMEFAINFGKNR